MEKKYDLYLKEVNQYKNQKEHLSIYYKRFISIDKKFEKFCNLIVPTAVAEKSNTWNQKEE